MSSNKLFTVILPTYNRASLLDRAIQSVVAQTFLAWELIVVDDGSTDNTRQLVEQYQQSDPRIRYIYQSNAERSAARNNGIANALGNYICFLDSDDAFEPEHLQGLFDAIQSFQNPVAMFISGVTRIEGDQTVQVPYDDIAQYANSVCYFLLTRESVIPSRVAIHRDILEGKRFDTQLKDVEDLDLWVQIAMEYPIYTIPNPTARYYLHDDNSTNRKRNAFGNQLQGLKKIFGKPEARLLIPSRVRRYKLSSCHLGIASYYEYHAAHWQAIFNIVLSIYYNPGDSMVLPKVKRMGYLFYHALRKS